MALTEVDFSELKKIEATHNFFLEKSIWMEKIEKETFRVEAQFSESVNACYIRRQLTKFWRPAQAEFQISYQAKQQARSAI